MMNMMTVCSTCLSADRVLYGLKNLTYLKNELQSIQLNMDYDYICWECKAAVTKMWRFKRRAAVAQQQLKDCMNNYDKWNALKSLSNLATRTITDSDETYKCSASNANDTTNEQIMDRDFKSEHNDVVFEQMTVKGMETELVKVEEIDERNYLDDDLYYNERDAPQIHNSVESVELELVKPEYNVSQKDKDHTIINYIKDQSDNKKLGTLVCMECPKLPCFKSPDTLLEHRATYHFKGVPKCDECGKEYKMKFSLVSHMKSHKLLKCKECNFKVKCKWKMRAHKSSVHSSKKDTADAKTFCEECQIQFKNCSGYKTHIKISAAHSKTNGRIYTADIKETLDKTEKKSVAIPVKIMEIQSNTKVIAVQSTSEGDLNKNNCKDVAEKFIKKRLSIEEVMAYRKKLQESPKYVTKKYKCEICITGFNTKYLYDLHMNDHIKKSGNACALCYERIEDSQMENHLNNDHYYIYECKECNHWNYKLEQMETHVSEHCTRRTLYKCKFCPDLPAFGARALYQYHMKSRHLAQRPTCNVCGKQYTAKGTLYKHMLKHTGIPLVECDICHKMIKSTSGLSSHKRKVHFARPVEAAYCVQCDRQYKTVASYHSHLNAHSSHLAPDAKKFECDVCHKTFTCESTLKQHHKRIHLRLHSKTCEICNKKFVTGTSLVKHIKKVHEGLKDPKVHCFVCNKYFTRYKLSEHMNTHTGERPFHCKLCPDAFAQRSSLYMHNRLVHLKLKKNRTTTGK